MSNQHDRSVRVRLFAAAREAAGVGEDTVGSGVLPAVLDALRDRYGPGFTEVLARCTVLVDGEQTPVDEPRQVRPGSEIAILPPSSGG